MTPNQPNKEMEHSKEPWGEFCHGGIRDSIGLCVADLNLAEPKWKANAARIVACVNFCKELTNEDLTRTLSAKELIQGIAKQQRLIESLRQESPHTKLKSLEELAERWKSKPDFESVTTSNHCAHELLQIINK